MAATLLQYMHIAGEEVIQCFY